MKPLPRIVHLASGREWRGGQRQVFLLARELHRQGVDQLVITTAGSRLAADLAAAGVPTRAVGWQIGLSPRALWAAIEELRNRPSILHAHDAHALTLAGIASRIAGSPFVVTRRVEFPLRRRGFWTRAAAVIAVSEAVRIVLLDDGIDAARITVVHSGIDLSAPAINPEGIRATLGLPESGPLVACVAALAEHKGHETLVRAAARLRDQVPALHWALAGDGPLRTQLEALARDLQVSPVIHFLGHLDDPRRLIATSTVVALASTAEGLGTSILDAQALGIPVVATRTGGIPEMLDGGAGILVAPNDDAALAEGIAQVVASGELRGQLAAKGYESVARFSDRGMATKVIQVYRSVVIERW